MSVPLEAEFAALKAFFYKQSRCCGDNCQRYQLLPIHNPNISIKRAGATNDFLWFWNNRTEPGDCEL